MKITSFILVPRHCMPCHSTIVYSYGQFHMGVFAAVNMCETDNESRVEYNFQHSATAICFSECFKNTKSWLDFVLSNFTLVQCLVLNQLLHFNMDIIPCFKCYTKIYYLHKNFRQKIEGWVFQDAPKTYIFLLP